MAKHSLTKKERGTKIELDAADAKALKEGLEQADNDPRRWTPEEVAADAKAMAKSWQKNLKDQASA